MKKFFITTGVGLACGMVVSYAEALICFGLGFSSSIDLVKPDFVLVRGAIIGLISAILWLACKGKSQIAGVGSAMSVLLLSILINFLAGSFREMDYYSLRPMIGSLILDTWCAYLVVQSINFFVTPILSSLRATSVSLSTKSASKKGSTIYKID